MALSKSRRIQILLAIDGIFFLIELIIGYSVHSLALVADSFHMLNDVLSLCVGLWAVKVAGSKTNNKMYTYGWQRAETLGALVNGVFLVALCLSIFLEAIQRFFEPQEVSHPQLILIVGCFGLASNIVGLFLFHDHSHGPGEHSHGRSHVHSNNSSDTLAAAEEGHAGHSHDSDETIADESGNIVDVLPQSQVGNWPSSKPAEASKRISYGSTNTGSGSASGSNRKLQKSAPSPSASSRTFRRHSRSRSRGYSGPGDISIHPASFRNEIIAASRLDDVESAGSTDEERDYEHAVVEGESEGFGETSPLLGQNGKQHKRKSLSSNSLHQSHNHDQPKHATAGGHGHSHGDLNMRGVFLHVMGDALGNIGVIASALFIWLTHFKWRFYSDPAISLIITVIILCSAIPLCKAASRILLQAVPYGLSIDDIREDITALPDVLSCHHLHVWQLSDTKLVASLHVQVAFEFKGEGSRRYMQLARQIRKCLHEYGIHSSTIQPEFCCEADHGHRMVEDATVHRSEDMDTSNETERFDGCLLDCDDECGDGAKCCPASPSEVSGKDNAVDHDFGHQH